MVRAPGAFGELGLADDDGAGVLQALDDGCGVAVLEARAEKAAGMGFGPGHRAQILDREGDAVKRAERLAALAARIGGLGVFHRSLGADLCEGVQLRFELGDARQCVARHLLRRHLAARDGLGHCGQAQIVKRLRGGHGPAPDRRCAIKKTRIDREALRRDLPQGPAGAWVRLSAGVPSSASIIVTTSWSSLSRD